MTRPTISWLAAAALAATLTALPFSAALAQNKGEVKIALIASKTGPLEAYAKQTIVGFNLGLEYATGGTMTVAGKKLVVIEKDDQGKPDVGKTLLAQAYADDKVDIAVGPTASPVALAMLPVAEEYKKILLVEPAVADSITGDKWNKYIFRTGRNSSQDAIANAVALDQAGTSIVTLAQDNAFGKDGVKAFKGAVKKAKIVYEEYLPAATTDFTAAGQRIIDKLKDQPGKKVVWIIWAGGNPFKIADMDLKRYGIEIATGGNILPAMVAYKQFPGMEGGAVLLLRHPEEQGQRMAGGPPLLAVQGPAGLLHRRRHGGRHRGGRGAEEDQRRHHHQQADRRDGRHELRDAEGQDDLPQGRPSGDAGHVPLQDQGGPGLRLGRARAGARDQGLRDGCADPEQALSACFGRLADRSLPRAPSGRGLQSDRRTPGRRPGGECRARNA